MEVRALKHDVRSTLLIETEPRKARLFKQNAIHPKSFGAANVGKSDTTLRDLRDYLDNVIFPSMQDKCADIRAILREHPFEE